MIIFNLLTLYWIIFHLVLSTLMCLQILEECTGLREELDRLQAERVGLYEETLHLQQHVEDTSREKRRLEHELDWLSQKSLGLREEAAVETRSHREQEETLAGKVRGHRFLCLSLC